MTKSRWAQVFSAAVAVAALFCPLAAVQAATLAESAELVTATSSLADALPAARTFSVATAGRYQVTLTDLGVPGPFASLKLVVTRGADKVIQLNAAGVTEFDAVVGSYAVQVVGSGATGSASTFAVEIAPAGGGAMLLQFTDGIEGSPAAADPAQTTLDTTFTVIAAGTYQVTLSDRAFPAALSSVDLLVLRQGATAPAGTLSAPGSFTFNAVAPGTYGLFVVATGGSADQAGLFSVKVAGGPLAETRFASTQPVGRLASPVTATLPLADTYTLVSSDFGLPAPLQGLWAAVAQGDQVLASVSGTSSASFPGSRGDVKVFSFARAATNPGAGSFGIKITRAGQTTYGQAHTVPNGYDPSGVAGYAYPVTIPSAGSYRLQLADFQFRTAFSLLQLINTRDGAVLGSLIGSGTLDVSLPAGAATLLVIAKPLTVSANSLFGVSMASPGSAPVLDRTQGVGGQFRSQTVTVSTAGSYDVDLRDLAFPAGFTELAMAATRGTTLVGQIVGGGRFSFTATPGTYSLSFLARLPAGAQYGLYGTRVETTPPLPTVTLTADPATVTSGQRTRLTWTSSDAASCTVSGSWTGTRPLSGTEELGPFSTNPTFTLACAGPGGSTSRSVTVTVSGPTSGKGGGGSFGVATLVSLLLLVWLRANGNVRQLWRRRAVGRTQ